MTLEAPSAEELAGVLARTVRRTQQMLQSRGLLQEEPEPLDALAQLQAQALQTTLAPAGWWARPARRYAVELDGYSLEAGTHLHAHDRQGLEHLCRYALRAPFSQQRLSRLADGRIRLELRRPAADGAQEVRYTPRQFLSRLAAIVPPPRSHLTRYHGVFAGRANCVGRVRPEAKPSEPPARTPARTGAPVRQRGGFRGRSCSRECSTKR